MCVAEHISSRIATQDAHLIWRQILCIEVPTVSNSISTSKTKKEGQIGVLSLQGNRTQLEPLCGGVKGWRVAAHFVLCDHVLQIKKGVDEKAQHKCAAHMLVCLTVGTVATALAR